MIINKILLHIFLYLLIGRLFSNESYEDFLVKLNNSFPAEIFFSQKDSNNIENKGWMIVGRKGLARVEFEPPNHLVMVSDGKWFIIHDAQYDRTSYLPLGKGILGALLYPEKLNSKNKITINKYIKDENIYYSILSEKYEGSELRVHFKKLDNSLKGWEIFENGKKNIIVEILSIKKLKNILELDSNMFKFKENMRASLNGFLGPYEREIKKIPSGKIN